LGVQTRTPADYLPDLTLRLQFYKKIAAAVDDFALSQLEDELCDRCGVPPEEVLNLLRLKSLKILLKKFHIKALELSGKKVSLNLDPNYPPATETILSLLQLEPNRYKLSKEQWFTVIESIKAEELYSWCEKLLQKIY